MVVELLPVDPYRRRLAWALVIWLTLAAILLPAQHPGGAREGSAALELTLAEAHSLARQNNLDLKLARLSLERGEVNLLALAETRRELQEQRNRLAQLMDQLDEDSWPGDWLENSEEEVEENPPFDFPVQPGDLKELLQAILEQLDLTIAQLEEQERQAKSALKEGREMISFQEELLLFQVESLFVAGLMLQEQLTLQQPAVVQLDQLLQNEREKEKLGYSSQLQVQEAASRLRQAAAAGDALATQMALVSDQLALACGLAPGSRLMAKPFTPQEPVTVDLQVALAGALASGRLIQNCRQALADRQAELERAKQNFGENSYAYDLAVIDYQQANLELQKAEQETAAAVHRAYSNLIEKANQVRRAGAELELGQLQQQALQAQLEAGYITVAEAAAGPLSRKQKETELLAARYQYHLAYREFELARRGYVWPGEQ